MALTQHIKLEHCEGLFAPPPHGAKGIAELFCVLPLARETSPHMFGIPPTFASTGVNLAGESIDPAFASAILSLSIGETTVFDRTIEKALQHWVPHSSDKQARTQPLEDTQSVSQEAASDTESVEGQFITPRIPPPRTSTSLMNPRRTAYSARAKRAGKGAEIRMGHSNTSKNRSNRRSKETGNPARMRKNWFGSTLNQIQTLAVHDETLEQVHIVPSQNTIIPLSSLQNSVGKTPSIFYQFQASLNPFERRFLRFIVLHYYPWRGYLPNDLRQIDTKNINYRLLHKMWNAFVNGFHRSDNPFKTFIKMHTQVQLKNALEAYVGLLKVTPCSGLPSRLRQGELSQSFNLAVQKIIEEGESSMQQNESVQGSNTTTEIFQEQTIVTTRTYMRQVSHSKEGEADGNRGITHERSANISIGSVNPNEDIHSATLDTNKAVPMISTSINQPESGDIGPQLDTPQQDDEHVQNVDESELNIIDNLQTTIDGEASDIQDDNPTSTREWVLKLNPELFDAVRQAPKSGTGRIKWPFVYAQWRRIGLPVHMNTSVYHSYNNSLKFKRKRDAQKNKNSLRNAVIRADSDSRIHENMSCSIHREETLRINISTDLEEGVEPLVALSNIVPPAPDDEIDNSLISQNTNKKINAPVPPGKRRKLRKTASASSSSSEKEDSTQDQPPSQPQRNLHTEKPGYQNLSIPENAITSQILGQVQQQKSNSVNINEREDLASLQSLDVSDADNERNGNEDVQDADLNKNILRRSRRLYVLSSKEDRTSATPKSDVIENQERRIASTSSAQGTRDGGDVQKHKQQIVKTCCTLGAKVKKLSQQLTLESIARCETELQTQASATSTTRQFLQFTEDEDQLIKHIWGCEQILIRPQQGRNTTIKWGPFQKRWLYLVAVLKLSKEGDNYNVRNREQLRQRMKYINPNPKQRKRRK